jgi:hypothetical protein
LSEHTQQDRFKTKVRFAGGWNNERIGSDPSQPFLPTEDLRQLLVVHSRQAALQEIDGPLETGYYKHSSAKSSEFCDGASQGIPTTAKNAILHSSRVPLKCLNDRLLPMCLSPER